MESNTAILQKIEKLIDKLNYETAKIEIVGKGWSATLEKEKQTKIGF